MITSCLFMIGHLYQRLGVTKYLKILTTHLKILTTHLKILTAHFEILTTHYGKPFRPKAGRVKKFLSKKQFLAEKDLFLIEFQQVLKIILIELNNTTVCKCKARKFMCLRERGRNACPCKNIGRFCSSACHKESQETCLNKQTVADGDCSSSEDSTVSTVQSVK